MFYFYQYPLSTMYFSSHSARRCWDTLQLLWECGWVTWMPSVQCIMIQELYSCFAGGAEKIFSPLLYAIMFLW